MDPAEIRQLAPHCVRELKAFSVMQAVRAPVQPVMSSHSMPTLTFGRVPYSTPCLVAVTRHGAAAPFDLLTQVVKSVNR